MRNKKPEQHISPIPFGESTERLAVNLIMMSDPENQTPSDHQSPGTIMLPHVLREVSAASSESVFQWLECSMADLHTLAV
eukprot:scaffold7180_cov50-Cyclotella_meneghiniana.AAC.4